MTHFIFTQRCIVSRTAMRIQQTYYYIDTLSFDPKVHTSRQTIHSFENLFPIQTFDALYVRVNLARDTTMPLDYVKQMEIYYKERQTQVFHKKLYVCKIILYCKNTY